MNPKIPLDGVKTYSKGEARAEWDSARESKRRMLLARVGKRESRLALKNWESCSAAEQKAIHLALNEDFYSPFWYIDKSGNKVLLAGDLPPTKTAPEISLEQAAERWATLPLHDRAMALYECHIGADAEQGKYCQWQVLAPDLRTKLASYFERVPVTARRQEPQLAAPVDPRQMSLF